MKIQNSSLEPTSPLAANASGGTTNTAVSAASGSDAVHLSRLGAALSTASAKIFDNPSRAQTLSNRVRSGSYQVDAQQISQRIINDALAA